MGACLIHGPMSVAIKTGEMSRINVGRGGSTPGTYSFGEMFQLLDFLDGKIEIPAEMRAICGYHVNYQPGPGAPNLQGADVCLIEPNGVMDIDFDGLKLNRAQVLRYVTTPLKTAVPDVARTTNHWYSKGILAANEEIRKSSSEQLLAAIPEEIEGRELMVGILERAHGAPRNPPVDLVTLFERIPIPLGIVAYAFQYLPDGRPVFWPPDFQQAIKDAIDRFKLPYAEPWRLVMEHGGKPVLREDMRHYADHFVPTVATYLSGFAADVASRGAVAA